MKIIDRKTSEIIPYEKNPRINNNAIDKTARSIKEFGFQQPIVVDPAGVVIAGHTRLKAAIKLKLETCPVIVADGLSDAQVKAYRIADNRTGELATWDNELLAVEIQDLIDMKYDIELTGFDPGDFNLGDKGGLTPDDEVPEVPDEPVTKLGDLWLLGDHRILCGDSTDVAQVSRLMDGQKADMVFTDPPYGMNLDTDYKTMYAKGTSGIGMSQDSVQRHDKVINDDRPFHPEFIFEMFGYCKEVFLWGADYYCQRLPEGGGWIVWDKTGGNDSLMKVGFGANFELCWSKQKHKRDIARFTWKGVAGRCGEKVSHPTQKSVKLFMWFFDRWGKEDDIVWDGYLGSGTTILACEKTNRICYGMEIDPKYCDVILKRWADYTGQEPVRIDGIKYKDLLKEV